MKKILVLAMYCFVFAVQAEETVLPVPPSTTEPVEGDAKSASTKPAFEVIYEEPSNGRWVSMTTPGIEVIGNVQELSNRGRQCIARNATPDPATAIPASDADYAVISGSIKVQYLALLFTPMRARGKLTMEIKPSRYRLTVTDMEDAVQTTGGDKTDSYTISHKISIGKTKMQKALQDALIKIQACMAKPSNDW